MALVTTVGGDTSDSYVTVQETDAYFSTHWNTALADLWSGLRLPQKERVLKSATMLLETLRTLDSEVAFGTVARMPWEYRENPIIHRLNEDQRLSFPRNVDVLADGTVFIPQAVKDAQCEQAVYLISLDTSALATQLQGVIEESVAAGPIKTYTNYSQSGSSIAPMTLELMRPYLRTGRRWKRA